MTSDIISELAATIAARRAETAETSYTRMLLEGGAVRCARKFGEEAIETVLAGVSGTPDELKAEAADVIYHLLVLLEARGIAWIDVAEVLNSRRGTSGHEEKAARKR
jgi:phosphoribosyl-ATP pyrophosphohydrolase